MLLPIMSSLTSSIVLSTIVLTSSTKVVYGPKNRMGPVGMVYEHEMTTCDEYSENARFNPLSLVGDLWFAFYFWTVIKENIIMQFFVPTKRELELLHRTLDPQVQKPINWTALHVVMKNTVDNTTSLLVEKNNRGHYWSYPYVKVEDGYLEPLDIRLKQTGDNRYWSLMICERTARVYIFSRINDIPKKKYIQDVVNRFNYRNRRGMSYLYQGHEWMPIPEANEAYYKLPEPLQEYYRMYDRDAWDDF